MLSALQEMAPQIAALPYEIWFAGLAGEEAGQHGAKALASQEKFDFVIAGEPTGLDVVQTHKGSARLSAPDKRGRGPCPRNRTAGENAI